MQGPAHHHQVHHHQRIHHHPAHGGDEMAVAKLRALGLGAALFFGPSA